MKKTKKIEDEERRRFSPGTTLFKQNNCYCCWFISLTYSIAVSISLSVSPPSSLHWPFFSFIWFSFFLFLLWNNKTRQTEHKKKKLVDSILILGFMFLYGSRLIGFAGHRQLNSEGLHDTLRNDLYTVAVSWIRNTSRHWLQKQRHQQQQQSKKQKQQQWIQ